MGKVNVCVICQPLAYKRIMRELDEVEKMPHFMEYTNSVDLWTMNWTDVDWGNGMGTKAVQRVLNDLVGYTNPIIVDNFKMGVWVMMSDGRSFGNSPQLREYGRWRLQ